MGDVLAIVEQKGGKVRGVALEVVSAAARLADGLGGTCTALVIGGDGVGASAGELGRFGAETVLVASDPMLDTYGPEKYLTVATRVAGEGDYAAILLSATAAGKDLAPRLAAALDIPLIADVVQVDGTGGAVSAVRPVYSGKALARVSADQAIVTVRPNALAPVESPAAGAVQDVSVALDPGAFRLRVKEFQAAGGGSIDVSEAGIVVSGGRGMKGPEHWEVLEGLRDALGPAAALGASRAVVDAGWRPHGEQVGQTGKTVSPQLYFAVGISGAIQHLAGMRSAKTIVAVNKDPDAPIFQVADYGIVGDLFDVVPAITREVQALKAQG
jgi:electron transfer flavoprotein alpha subunit